MSGVVVHGDQRGRLLGFPTANIDIPHGGAPNGVWAGTVSVESEVPGSLYVAAISIGARPTYYAAGRRLLEANLLDYTGDLYGKTLVVTARLLVRRQRRFSGPAELSEQIDKDVSAVRQWALRAGLDRRPS